MRIAIVLLLFSLISCNNHSDEVDNAITSLEYIDYQLDEIGERNIHSYKSRSFVPTESNDYSTDTIKLSLREYLDIQQDIHCIIEDLDKLSSEMRKECETE